MWSTDHIAEDTGVEQPRRPLEGQGNWAEIFQIIPREMRTERQLTRCSASNVHLSAGFDLSYKCVFQNILPLSRVQLYRNYVLKYLKNMCGPVNECKTET